jgi:arylsulfatase A-like enzyme
MRRPWRGLAREIATGALGGVLLAAVLAGAECLVRALASELRPSPAVHPPLRFGTTALLLGAALALGAAAGAGAAPLLCLARRGRPGGAAGPWRWLAPTGLAAAGALWLGAALHRAPGATLPPEPALSAARPGVVIVVLDTVRSDHLSLYGYARDTSPALEEFARTATLYTRAIAASDLTLSTHASLFTGLYARSHGARVDPRRGPLRLPERLDTLAEFLVRAGYLSLAVVSNPGFLQERFGLAQGFHHYDVRRPAPLLPASGGHLLAAPLRRAARALGAASLLRAEPFRRAEEINREVFALLERVRDRRQPLLLFVNYNDAHWPYDPPPPFDERYPGKLRSARATLDDRGFEALRFLERSLSPEEQRHLVSQYDGEIAYADSQLGALLARLREVGRFDQSLILITSDHGEALGEHGLVEHGVSVYQDQVHVPLLIKFPAQRQPEVVDALVGSVDVLPTVLDTVGLPEAAASAGVSLRSGAPPRDRIVVSESYPSPRMFQRTPRFRRIARAIYLGEAKLIASTAGPSELYDLSSDPAELRDARRSDAPRVAALESRLADWLAAQPAAAGEPAAVDPEAGERLRALGYGE